MNLLFITSLSVCKQLCNHSCLWYLW